MQHFAKPLTQASPALNSGSYVFKFRAVLFVVVIAAVNCFLLVFRLTFEQMLKIVSDHIIILICWGKIM